jgi:hypothetical protein
MLCSDRYEHVMFGHPLSSSCMCVQALHGTAVYTLLSKSALHSLAAFRCSVSQHACVTSTECQLLAGAFLSLDLNMFSVCGDTIPGQ